MQVSTLLSIKTGACPEDCAYCPQSIRYDTGLEREALMEPADVVERARAAREAGATRFCMGAAWRSPKDRDLEKVAAMVEGVAALGLETCATLGMLTPAQAERLKAAGLDYYNHNLDTSEAFYGEVITTRTYQDRLDTLAAVRDAGIHVCCGGILGMGETADDRVAFLHTLATLDPHPESVPINNLVQVEGTPLAGTARARSDRVRAHRRARAHPDAALARAALRGPRADERRDAGALLPRRRELDLLRREAPDDGQPGHGERPRAVRPARHPARARRSRTAERVAALPRVRRRARGPRRARPSPPAPQRPTALRTTPQRSSSTARAASISAATTTSASPRIRA